MKKTILSICIMITAIVCMTACGNKTPQKENPASESNASSTATALPDEDQQTPVDDSDDSELAENEDGGIEIYTIDTDSLEIQPLSVKIQDKKLTAKSIVKAVVDNLDEEVGIYKVSHKSKTVTVAFLPDKAPLTGCSGQVEELILDCISSSLLDNLMDCEKVVFTGKNAPYESGHLSFDLNEVYATK